MKRAFLVAVALGLTSTLHAQGYEGWERRIIGRLHFRDIEDVPFAYQRPDDPLIGEIWFLVGDDGSLCRVSAADWVMAQDVADWRCRWRYARGQ